MMEKYEEMLLLKESLGYSKRTYSSYIVPFIEYCAANFEDASTITREMVDSWLLTDPYRSSNSQRIAIINIRHFTKHLCSTGIPSFIPPSSYNVKYQPYQPYIFTDDELKYLFEAIDSVKFRKIKADPARIMPVLYRLELCCGLRPGEPFKIKCEDINLETGDIFIILPFKMSRMIKN